MTSHGSKQMSVHVLYLGCQPEATLCSLTTVIPTLFKPLHNSPTKADPQLKYHAGRRLNGEFHLKPTHSHLAQTPRCSSYSEQTRIPRWGWVCMFYLWKSVFHLAFFFKSQNVFKNKNLICILLVCRVLRCTDVRWGRLGTLNTPP